MGKEAPQAGASLQVRRGTLTQAAGQAGQISRAIEGLAGDVPSACSSAASAHSGWRFGQALSAVVPSWEHHLQQQSSAVAAAGGKLTNSAHAYATVENDLVARAQAICPSADER